MTSRAVHRLVVVLVACLLAAVSVSAQVINPTRASFTASADHTATVGGVAVLDHYQLDVMVGTSTGALAFTRDLGKPSPDAQGTIVVTVPEFATQPTGSYVARVTSVGPGGATSSDVVPFSRMPAPAAPTAVAVQR